MRAWPTSTPSYATHKAIRPRTHWHTTRVGEAKPSSSLTLYLYSVTGSGASSGSERSERD